MSDGSVAAAADTTSMIPSPDRLRLHRHHTRLIMQLPTGMSASLLIYCAVDRFHPITPPTPRAYPCFEIWGSCHSFHSLPFPSLSPSCSFVPALPSFTTHHLSPLPLSLPSIQHSVCMGSAVSSARSQAAKRFFLHFQQKSRYSGGKR